MARSPLALTAYFATLHDPRVRRRRRHHLLDIVAIAVCAVVGGADNWVEIAAFGRRHLDWFKRFLRLPNGIPSHDTFERLFDRLDPQAFGRCLWDWTRALSAALGVDHIAIDGKALCGSGSEALGPLHVVSAWAARNQLTLGQVAVASKSNEITAIPKLLELLDLNGALVTIDAMGCQKNIAKQIVEQGGDYLLTVKDNQGRLAEDIRACFEKALDTGYAGLDYDEYATAEYGHGRQERRWYTIIRNPSGIRDREAWAGLRVIGMCYSERGADGETIPAGRYFIGSAGAGAKRYGRALRGHWGVENHLHWQLDIAFKEDANRTGKRLAAENLAALRRLAVGLLKRHPGKGSMATKRKEAGWDVHLLEEILKG